MIKAILKATIKRVLSENNPYYGKMTSIHTINDVCQMEYNKFDDVAPFGITAFVSIGCENIDFYVSKDYFISDGDGWYYADFQHGDKVYAFKVLIVDGEIDLEESYLSTYRASDFLDCNYDVIEKVFAKDFEGIARF